MSTEYKTGTVRADGVQARTEKEEGRGTKMTKGLDDQLTCFYHNAYNTWREATIEQRPLKDYEISDIASTIRAYVETALETLQEARELASCLEIKLDEHDHELTDAAHDAARWIDSAADGFTFLEILGTIDQEIVERLNTHEYPA